MYSYNTLILKTLPELLNMSRQDLLALTDTPPSSYCRWIQNENIPLASLVELCNRLRISISHFFYAGAGSPVVPTHIIYRYTEEEFRPILFRKDYLAGLFGEKGELMLPITEICEKIGVTRSAYLGWVAEDRETTVRMKPFIRLCNTFGLDLNDFFDDPNMEMPRPESRVSFNRKYSRELYRKNAEIEELKARLGETMKELEVLRVSKELLEKRIQELVNKYGLSER